MVLVGRLRSGAQCILSKRPEQVSTHTPYGGLIAGSCHGQRRRMPTLQEPRLIVRCSVTAEGRRIVRMRLWVKLRLVHVEHFAPRTRPLQLAGWASRQPHPTTLNDAGYHHKLTIALDSETSITTATMSVTTTQNPVTGSVLQVLADYDLHHSGDPAHPREAERPNLRPEPSINNPHWWPSDHNRVPPYRPINRNLDLEQRPDGANAIERTFIFVMLNGCGLNAVWCNQ